MTESLAHDPARVHVQIDHGDEQAILAAEMIIHQGVVDARLRCDRAEAGPRVSVGEKPL